jgi:hypothetical protein
LQGLIAAALNPVAQVKTKTLTTTALASSTVDVPSALPSLSSTLVGVKTSRALRVKPTKASDTEAASTATATTPGMDTTAAVSGGKNAQSTKTHGRHSASAGDQSGRHARSHGSSAGGKGGSGGGRHHAA